MLDFSHLQYKNIYGIASRERVIQMYFNII